MIKDRKKARPIIIKRIEKRYNLEDLETDLNYFETLGIGREETKSYIKFLLESTMETEVREALERKND